MVFVLILVDIVSATRRHAWTVVAALGICGLITWCLVAEQPAIVGSLDAAGMALAEMGAFSKIRILQLVTGVFEERDIREYSVAEGVSNDGKFLLLATYTGRYKSSVHAPDEMDVVRPDGVIVKAFVPSSRGLGAISAELSPDWHKVAFIGTFAGAKSYGLHIFDESGTITTIVTTAEAKMPLSVSWSKDSRTVVFDLDGYLWLYSISSGKRTQLMRGDTPIWSPDGVWITYRHADHSGGVLHLPDFKPQALLEGVKIADSLRWAPDSRHLLFTDEKGGQIRILDFGTGKVETLMRSISGKTASRLRWVCKFTPIR